MKKNSILILSISFLWAAIIIASSLTLLGTEYNSPILIIQGIGSAASVIIIGGLYENSSN